MIRLLLAPLAMTVAALDALLEAVVGPLPPAVVVDGVGPWAGRDPIEVL